MKLQCYEFNDVGGRPCSLQDTSGPEPQVWLGLGEHRMCLNPRQARLLSKLLSFFAVAERMPSDRMLKRILERWE